MLGGYDKVDGIQFGRTTILCLGLEQRLVGSGRTVLAINSQVTAVFHIV